MIISESKKENYCTEVLKNNVSIFTDAPEEKGGKGQYLNPSDLLCASLASCLNITTRMMLNRENLNYEKVVVKVSLDNNDENKVKFSYQVDIEGDVSDEKKKLLLEELEKCPIRKTLSKEMEFENISKIWGNYTKSKKDYNSIK